MADVQGEPGPHPHEGPPEPQDYSEVSWDCTPWSGEARRTLRTVLDGRGIPHAWEGTVLVARAEFEDAIDELVDEVSVADRPTLRPGGETEAWDVSPWSVESQAALTESFFEAGIPHEWSAEGLLVVNAEDSERVEELIDGLGDPDGGEDMDGLELHDRLGELFVAADRLVSNPRDTGGAAGVIEGVGVLSGVALPFGVDSTLWRDLRSAGQHLVEAIAAARDGEGPWFRTDEDPVDAPTGGTDDADVADAEGGDNDPVAATPSVEALAVELRRLLRQLV